MTIEPVIDSTEMFWFDVSVDSYMHKINKLKGLVTQILNQVNLDLEIFCLNFDPNNELFMRVMLKG